MEPDKQKLIEHLLTLGEYIELGDLHRLDDLGSFLHEATGTCAPDADPTREYEKADLSEEQAEALLWLIEVYWQHGFEPYKIEKFESAIEDLHAVGLATDKTAIDLIELAMKHNDFFCALADIEQFYPKEKDGTVRVCLHKHDERNKENG